MSKRIIFSLLLGLIGLSACSGPTTATATPESLPTVTETPFQPELATPLPDLVFVTPTPEATPTNSPNLGIDQLRNGEYRTSGLSASGELTPFRLVDASFRSGDDPAAIGYAAISLIEPTAFGSLNNDEFEDAVVILVENYGGTGQFVNIAAVLNQAGQPFHAASYYLGDRVQVNSLTIQDKTIQIEAVIHGPQDGACCPSVPATIHLGLINENQLMLTRQTTKTPNGLERAINIRAPLSGSEASGSITISGDVTIAPFENNLTYTIYDSQYREITRSWLMVDAPDFGAPGTFALVLDLAALGLNGDIYVDITEFSPADGSVISLAQIQLKVR